MLGFGEVQLPFGHRLWQRFRGRRQATGHDQRTVQGVGEWRGAMGTNMKQQGLLS